MGRLIKIVLLLVIVAAGVGYWRGWFQFTSTETVDGKTHIGITVDKDKIKEDEAKAAHKAREIGEQVKDKIGTPPADKPASKP